LLKDIKKSESELRKEPAKVICLSYFELDFNTHPMSLSISSEIKKKIPGLHMLSGHQGDLICITSQNKHGWVEGYLVKDPLKTLGIVHSKFIQQLI